MKRKEAQEAQGQGGRLSKLLEADRTWSDFIWMTADNATIFRKQQLFIKKIL